VQLNNLHSRQERNRGLRQVLDAVGHDALLMVDFPFALSRRGQRRCQMMHGGVDM